MRLTIIVPDKTVCKDGVCYSGITWQGTPDNVRALQWYGTYGVVELTDYTNEDVTELPPWAISAEAAWDTAANPPPPPPPTPEENQAQNKVFATSLLKATDWVATVDIADPTYSDPYLANQSEFLAYRSQVRAIAVNPPTTLVTNWPTLPNEDWQAAP